MNRIFLLIAVFFCTSATAQLQFTVYFDFDIDEANTASGKKLSQWISENNDAEITAIYGYADSIGNALYNIDLSERRADYVLEQLKQSNIAVSTDVKVNGYGESEAVAANRAMDRKAVLHYSKKQQEKPAKPESEFSKTVNTAKKGDKLRLPNMNFYNNSDIMLPESMPILEELLGILKSKSRLKIEIQGHICCQLVEENQVSLRRAVAVYKYLIANGIDKERLSYKSFGSSRPIHKLPERSEAEKVANRRVEIEIIEN